MNSCTSRLMSAEAMTRKRLLHSNSFPGACASLSCPASLLTVPIRISVTNSVSRQQVCVVSFDSSTLGKELYCHVRLHMKKPSGSPRFVFMVADQGILADSTFSCYVEEVTVSVLNAVVTRFWKGEAFSHEQFLMWENVDDLTISWVNGVMSRLNVGSLPCCLRSLSFDHEFNECLDRVTIPSCVQTIVFGDRFNPPLHRVFLPCDLQHLTFSRCFNQSMFNVRLPLGLQSLKIGPHYD